MPIRIGRNSTVMIGSTRVAAPIGRRISTPHAPPDNWWTMPSARQPSVMPRHSMYAIRYDCRNCCRFKTAPTIESAPPTRPTPISFRCRPASSGIATSALRASVSPDIERSSLRRRNVRERRVLAQLQRADVGDDRPAVFGADLRRVVGHRAEAVGDDVEEVPDGRLSQAILVVGRRLAVTALDD